jgi:long-chain acyl-CoA synthetase
METPSKRVWLKSYPKGIPAEIDSRIYDSINDIIEEACNKYSDTTAFMNMGAKMSFRETLVQSQAFASYLQHELKLKKGDRIAIQMPNVLQYPVVLFGALLAGAVIVNTNPLYTTREMEHQFKDSGAVAIVILANFASKLEEILPQTQIKHIIVSELGDFFPTPKRQITNLVVKHVKKMVPAYNLKHTRLNDALKIGAQKPYQKTKLAHADIAFLQYTGGTTGVSKGAILTHGNMTANVLQMSEWLKIQLDAGQERILMPLPLYHIFSLTVNCFGLFMRGMTNILITNPRDIPALTKEIKTTQPTVITLVNTLAAALIENADFRALDFSKLKITVAGGMALKAAIANRWREITGTHVFEGYGLTEASPVVSCNPLNDDTRVGTIGLPVPSTDVKLINEDGKEVAPGEAGELCVKGPQVMQGYHNREDETKNVITPDGWLKTGDMAIMHPDGFFQIVDRKKDMILVSGFNVYPNEIEEVLMKHPGILEVAAVGVEDEHSGEVVKVVIVPRDPKLTEKEVRDFSKTQLTSYKVPKHVEFRKELPKNNVGKILRRMLRDK